MAFPSKYYERAYSRLRSVRPAGVAAIDSDGELTQIAAKRGASKGKWERVLAAAQKLHAEGLQLFDVDGNVIEVLDLVEPHERASALATVDEEENPVGIASFAKLADIMLNACDRSVERQAEQMRAVLDAALGLMKVAAERAERSDRALEKLIRAQTLQIERGGGAIQKASVMDDVTALIAAAKASGFDVERFFSHQVGARGKGNGFDDNDGLEPDEILDAPTKEKQ